MYNYYLFFWYGCLFFVDINECDSPSHTCTEHQSCKNTFGSFTCVCKDGYILGTLQDTITCRGIFFPTQRRLHKGARTFSLTTPIVKSLINHFNMLTSI